MSRVEFADPNQAQVLVVDVQSSLVERLHHYHKMLERIELVLTAAEQLEVPILGVEQYPQGLGHSVANIQQYLTTVLSKTRFSAAQVCEKHLAKQNRKQLVIVGCEAHVCVLQTAMECLQLGYHVLIVSDGVSSRLESDKSLAIARLRGLGCTIVSAEMLIFEWLRDSKHPKFRTLLPHLK